jgi:hypothetical protein
MIGRKIGNVLVGFGRAEGTRNVGRVLRIISERNLETDVEMCV